ncbi:MAG TPA: hypothetical protein VMW77_03300 [Methanoregula sp.]|nr:hypothetical protein [Methanoregula sp.]
MRWGYVILALGISVCLAGAFIMVAGESVLGESHTGIASVVGIVGIGLIVTSGSIIAGERARALKPKN